MAVAVAARGEAGLMGSCYRASCDGHTHAVCLRLTPLWPTPDSPVSPVWVREGVVATGEGLFASHRLWSDCISSRGAPLTAGEVGAGTWEERAEAGVEEGMQEGGWQEGTGKGEEATRGKRGLCRV